MAFIPRAAKAIAAILVREGIEPHVSGSSCARGWLRRGGHDQPGDADALSLDAALPDGDAAAEADSDGAADGTGGIDTDGEGGRHCGSGFVRSPSCWKNR